MSRDHPFALHRSIPAAIVVALALVVLFALAGPTWWQRMYHPLRYEAEIVRASQETGVDPYLVAALINAESGFDESQVSEAGAVGLMQLMPSTAVEVAARSGVTREVDMRTLKDPDLNITLGTRHLADLLATYDDTETALAAYNAGAGNVERWMSEQGGTTLAAAGFAETRAYVDRVLSERSRYRELYPGAFE